MGTLVSTPALLGIPIGPEPIRLTCPGIGSLVWYGVYGRPEKAKRLARFSPGVMGRPLSPVAFGCSVAALVKE